VSISVKVLPPWWRTWWFFSSGALVVMLLVLAGFRLYAGHLRQQSRDLELLVQERTVELERSREQFRIQATHDGLTGMLNRLAIMNALMEETERARRGRKPFVLALVDLDHFKRVNDTCGHLVGDEVLRIFAAAIKNTTRPYDRCGRYGGEEFLFVLPDVPPNAAEERLASLHNSISNIVVGNDESGFAVTCSIGAVLIPPPAAPVSPEPFLAIADAALYEAKASGRNRVVIRKFDGTTAVPEMLFDTATRLGHALR
jgi:diguanylate cyclase (GGDEF)-like protein